MSAGRRAARQLFAGKLRVHYAQAYVSPVERVPYGFMEDCFLGQSNGLCGAATLRHLFLITGLHTGWVGFTVDLVAKAPPLDRRWEDVVEVSLFVDAAGVALEDWDGNAFPLALAPGWYRVRYHAQGMDAGHEADTSPEDGRVIDEYRLVFWPQPHGDGAVLAQGSRSAAYWHRFASGLVPHPTESVAPGYGADPQIRAYLAHQAEPQSLREAVERIRTIVDAALLPQSPAAGPAARNRARRRRQSRP